MSSTIGVSFDAKTDSFEEAATRVRDLSQSSMRKVADQFALGERSVSAFSNSLGASALAAGQVRTAWGSLEVGANRYAASVRSSIGALEEFRRKQDAAAMGDRGGIPGRWDGVIQHPTRYSESPFIDNLYQAYYTRTKDSNGQFQDSLPKQVVDAVSPAVAGLVATMKSAGAEISGFFSSIGDDAAKLPATVTTSTDAIRAPISSLVSDVADTRLAFGGLSVAAGLAGSAITLGAAAVAAAIPIYIEAEKANQKLEFALRASANGSGMTVGKVSSFASDLASTTLATRNGVVGAAAALTRFDRVSGPMFERTIRLAQDLAATLGGSLSSETERLGKALDDPTKALDSFESAGIRFTAAERAMVTSLTDAGNTAQAQTTVLDLLQQKVGGNGAAEAGGVAGAFGAATISAGEFVAALADVSGISPAVVGGLNVIAAAAAYARVSMTGARVAGYGDHRSMLDGQIAAAQQELADQESTAKLTGYRPEGAISAAKQRLADLQAQREALDGANRSEADSYAKAAAAQKAAAADRQWKDAKKEIKDVEDDLEKVATTSEKVKKIHEDTAETIAKLRRSLAVATTDEQKSKIEEAIKKAGTLEKRKIEEAQKSSNSGLDSYQSALVAQQKRTEILTKEGSLIGDTTHQLDYYRSKLELETAAKRGNIPISKAMAAEIEKSARAYQAAEVSVDGYKKAIALADEVRSDTKGFANTFTQDMLNGKTAVESLGDAVTQLRNKLAQRFEDSLIDMIMGKSGTPATGALGSIFGGLFGGGASAPAATAAAASSGGGLFSWFASLFHEGGVAGAASAGRFVSPSTFSGAPRFHSGLLPNELPAILLKGETVLNNGLTNRLSGTISGLADMAANANSSSGGMIYSPSINVSMAGSSGNPTTDRNHANNVAAQMKTVLDAHSAEFTRQQMRPGGLLKRGELTA